MWLIRTLTLVYLLAPGMGGASKQLAVSGPQRLSEDGVRALIGEPPADKSKRKGWADQAIKRVLERYRAEGYTYARAWADVSGTVVHIAIDEGRNSVVFVGAGIYHSVLYRIDTGFNDKTFHRPTVDAAMAKLKLKYGLKNIYFRMSDEQPMVPNGLGQLVPQRVLRIYVITQERFGWGLKMTLDSNFGIVPEVEIRLRDVALTNDRFWANLGIGVPFRKFLFDEAPKFQWVHGAVQVAYRLPPFAHGYLAPQIESDAALSRYSRSGQDLQSYLRARVDAVAMLVVLLSSSVSIGVGGGVSYSYAFDIDPPEAEDSGDLARFIVRLEPEIEFFNGVRRRDRRDEIKLRVDVGFSSDAQAILDARIRGQYVIDLGRFTLIVGGRGLLITGATRFWDEINIAGDHLRTFFDNRYWVLGALQTSLDFRWTISDIVQLGAFHDLALFGDRTSDGARASMANSFGPSVHFLLFDLLALDLFYGFGFAAVGFDHTFSFRLETAF